MLLILLVLTWNIPMLVSELIDHLKKLDQNKTVYAVVLPHEEYNVGSIVETFDSVNMYIIHVKE